MAVEPAGVLSLAQKVLRDTLADCTNYRGLTTPAMDQAAALASIHYEGLPPPANGHSYTRAEIEGYRPFAVICEDEDNSLLGVADSISSHTHFKHTGNLLVTIERNCPAGQADTPSSEATLQWRNIAGLIFEDLEQKAGVAGYLNIMAIRVEWNPSWSTRKLAESDGLFQGVQLGISWEGAGQ